MNQKIAVVGSCIPGLGAAWLLAGKHEIHLFGGGLPTNKSSPSGRIPATTDGHVGRDCGRPLDTPTTSLNGFFVGDAP